MVVEVSTLSRTFEFIHVPIQHAPETLRDVYLSVSRSCDYDNFIRTPDGARLESVEANLGSSVTFHKDRIVFREDGRQDSLENLWRRIEETINVVVDTVGVPLFVARNLTFRAIMPAPKGQHAAQLMAESVFKLSNDQFADFGRPAHVVGFRLQFPPRDPARDALHQVRVESYLKDSRSLYIEDIATFRLPVQSRDRKRLGEEAREVESFVNEKLSTFVTKIGEQSN